MSDKIMALVALATMVAFLAVVIVEVPHLDLAIVVIVVSLMAAYDFFLAIFRQRNGIRK